MEILLLVGISLSLVSGTWFAIQAVRFWQRRTKNRAKVALLRQACTS